MDAVSQVKLGHQPWTLDFYSASSCEDNYQTSIHPTLWTLQEINALCDECSSLIESHEKIQLLSMVHYNLGKTLEDVENIAALPAEAAAAEQMLRDDYQLLQVRSGVKGKGVLSRV